MYFVLRFLRAVFERLRVSLYNLHPHANDQPSVHVSMRHLSLTPAGSHHLNVISKTIGRLHDGHY